MPQKPSMNHQLGFRQRGSVLGISLLLLVVMTLIGLAAVQTTMTEEKVSRNLRAKEVSFLAAETALRDGEFWIDQQREYPAEKLCEASTCKQISVISPADTKFDDTNDFLGFLDKDWDRHGRELQLMVGGKPLELEIVAQQPRYIVREARFMPDTMTRGIEAQPGRYLYEVTAWGVGTSAQIQTVLRSTFIRRY